MGNFLQRNAAIGMLSEDGVSNDMLNFLFPDNEFVNLLKCGRCGKIFERRATQERFLEEIRKDGALPLCHKHCRKEGHG